MDPRAARRSRLFEATRTDGTIDPLEHVLSVERAIGRATFGRFIRDSRERAARTRLNGVKLG